MDVDMKEAPARISMIMQVSRVVPMMLVQKLCQLSAPDHQAIASAPNTPQAAHSVAVAQPSSNTTNTSTISSVHGIRLRDSLSFSRSVISGSGGGILCGCMRAQTAMYPE